MADLSPMPFDKWIAHDGRGRVRNAAMPSTNTSGHAGVCWNKAAKAAIMRDYGNVIGEQQAENIAFIALLAARTAVSIESKESDQ